MLKTFSIAAALSLAALCAPAHAADLGQITATETVGYSDLNVHSMAGAQALLHRIKAAAARVCGPAPDIHDLHGQQIFRSCMGNSTAEAVAAVGDPLMAAFGTRSIDLAARN